LKTRGAHKAIYESIIAQLALEMIKQYLLEEEVMTKDRVEVHY